MTLFKEIKTYLTETPLSEVEQQSVQMEVKLDKKLRKFPRPFRLFSIPEARNYFGLGTSRFSDIFNFYFVLVFILHALYCAFSYMKYGFVNYSDITLLLLYGLINTQVLAAALRDYNYKNVNLWKKVSNGALIVLLVWAISSLF